MKNKTFVIFALFLICLIHITGYASNFIYISISNGQNQGRSPAEFYIEDQYGRKTGYDNVLRKSYHEIPDALYDQWELSDDLDSLWVKESYYFQTREAYMSVFTIAITTSEVTPYRIYIEAGRKEDPSLFRVIYQDTFKPDEKKMYKLAYSTDPSIPLRVEEVESLSPITLIDQMIESIRTAFSEGQITSKGIANSLIVKLETARKHLEKGKPKQAMNVLNSFLNELEAQHEKHIAGEVYDYLKETVTPLITRLGLPE